MPLLSAGRTRDQFWNTLTATEYKQVPEVVMRKASVLAVNMWLVCGRKKTQRPNFEMPPVILRSILSLIGDKLESGARYDPKISAAALTAKAEAAQQKICDQILRNLSKHLGELADAGQVHSRVAVDEILPKGLSWDVPPEKRKATEADSCEWTWLLTYLKPLKSTLKNAGYTFELPPVLRERSKRESEADEGADDQPKQKVWSVRFVWMKE
eukprot:g8408.t1